MGLTAKLVDNVYLLYKVQHSLSLISFLIKGDVWYLAYTRLCRVENCISVVVYYKSVQVVSALCYDFLPECLIW